MKNKILFIVEADLKSGSGKCAWELIKLTKQRTEFIPSVITQHHNDLNDACSALCIENYSTHYARTCSLGMGWLGWVIAFCCRPFLNYLSFIKLKKRIDFNSICIIHSNSSSIDFGAYLHKKLHIPHIWHIREFFVYPQWKPLVPNFHTYIAKNATIVITVSNLLKKHLLSKKDFNNIQAIYDGVPTPKEQADLKKNLNTNILRIVCVGNLAPIKGQDFLLESLALLQPEILNKISIDFFGDFVGKDDYKKRLDSIIKKHSLEKNIRFLGFCDNIQTKLVDYDVGIQPSHSEGFSRVTVEYMLAGLCVIGNGNTAIQELVDHEKTGFLYNDLDSQKLAHYIAFCYRNRDTIKEMGNYGRKKAIENYCIEKNFDKLMNVYNHISTHQ